MTVEEALALIESALESGRLTKIQELVLRHAWDGMSYEAIARTTGYDTGYIKDTGSKLWRLLSDALGTRTTKFNFQVVLRNYSQRIGEKNIPTSSINFLAATSQQDWGEAPDVSIFYGRNQELTTLGEWLLRDRCRLVTILGLGGVGKTALSVKLAQQIQGEFEFLIWRSLRDTPSLSSLLSTLISFFSRHEEINLPETTEEKLARLMVYLRESRCLLVLDNLGLLDLW
ncbi:MAG: NB-ARC domain-containing protein [Leptolyngbyaceae bacterium]|nr:NB-ARC domain-containing protein [Leptolyngbyaceae bacterium]